MLAGILFETSGERDGLIMTEQDRELIIRLWNSRMSLNSIARMLPYPTMIAKQYVNEVKASGALKAENRVMTHKQLILTAYANGMVNPHQIASEFELPLNSVRAVLSAAKLNRKRPPHNYVKRLQAKLSDKTQQILTDVQQGLSNVEVAKKHNVTRQYVYKIKKNYTQIIDNQ